MVKLTLQFFNFCSAFSVLSCSLCCCCCCYVASVISDSVRPHRRQPTRLRRPWDCPGKHTGVDCHCLLHLLSIVDFYSVTSFFLRLQSSQTYAESFTRTNSTMYINNYEHTQKPGKLFKKLFFMMCRVFFLLDYLFSIQNMVSEGWNHYHQSFFGLSHTPSTPRLTCHSLHLTPYRSSFLLESPFHLFVALKLVFSFLHWEKSERVAGLCGKWEEHRG